MTVAEIPADYESRLSRGCWHSSGTTSYWPSWRATPTAIAKMSWHSRRAPGLDTEVLRSRYQNELRPTLGRPDREDLTLEPSIELIAEVSGRAPRP